MKYKLIVMRLPRTGTTMLWKTLRQHPEICGSWLKEPYLPIWYKNKYKICKGRIDDEQCYLDFFKIKNEKILLDGTPVVNKANYLKFLKSLPFVDDIVCVNVKRNTMDRVISTVMHSIRWWFEGNSPVQPEWIDDDDNIILDKLRGFIEYHERSELVDLDKLFGADKYISIDIDRINKDQDIIYDFLGIKRMSLNFKRIKNRSVGMKNITINKLKSIIQTQKVVEDYFNE